MPNNIFTIANIDFLRLSKAQLIVVTLDGSITYTYLPDREHWIILSGVIHHITGTQTYFQIRNSKEEYDAGLVPAFENNIASGTANSDLDIYTASGMQLCGGFRPLIVPAKGIIVFQGGAGAQVTLQILRVVA